MREQRPKTLRSSNGLRAASMIIILSAACKYSGYLEFPALVVYKNTNYSEDSLLNSESALERVS